MRKLGREMLRVVLLTALVLPVACWGQDPDAKEKEKEEKPKGWLRLIPVGEAPPFQQKIIDGVRHQVDPPKGSIPPRNITVPTGAGKKEEPLSLALGRTTAALRIPAGQVAIKSVEEAGAEPEPWHLLQMPEKTAALALLWRDPTAKSWSKARSLTLADDLLTFPPGTIRVINVSPWSVAIIVEGEKIGLRPGQNKVAGKPGVPKKQVAVEVAIADGKGGWQKVANQVCSQAAAERSNIIIYQADGVRPRSPAKVKVIREKAGFPAIPAKEKRL